MTEAAGSAEALRAALLRGDVPPEDGMLLWAADAAVQTLQPMLTAPKLAVAVSGGSDSMAALVLLSALHPVEAVTLDHGLRPEAADEAAFVARFCAARGIAHTTLHWEGRQARGNLMEAARLARLRLIGAWARARGIGAVALGHTADDQAETFLMRLAREAGLEGLSGMRESFESEGVLWFRPFLSQTRAELRGHLERQGIGWIEDPSNANERFDRVKARKALAALSPLGISAGTLATVVGHLAMAEQSVLWSLEHLAKAHVRLEAGDVVIDARGFRNAFDAETSRRLINAALMWVSGAEYPPRAAKVMDVLMSWRIRRDRTLHGCRILVGDDVIRITREARAVADLRVPFGQIWDGWQIEGPEAPGLEVAALGSEGWKQLGAGREKSLPRPTLLASPALWQGKTLISAPLAGLKNGYQARLVRPSFTVALIRR
ncbi:tRNA(Ile)-lysidine synthase [Rhodobacter viridis]|uniref:tRNA(Ile)-lysidine synthase n=1 Tax=Rhodobacter viridis TaxID=1054202 RepID=A0A318U046_9RHOB|nr:tRNA lysidine(34) synthetase TilS [Rhodobacter viridis]PYF09337.1 tRNA(Ile)-lysidine synthase [Rhodobacter viridis]